MKKTIKKALKIIGCILVFSLAIIIYISYIVDHNSQELDKLESKVIKHYTPESKIKRITKYSNYYIIKTSSKAIVLNDKYETIIEEDLSKLNNELSNQELIYKTNKLMYEKKYMEKNKLTYEYYDAISGELINKTILEQQ